MRVACTLMIVLLAATSAAAQQCADEPPGWQPHVRAHVANATLVTEGELIRGAVYVLLVHCSYGPGEPPVGRGELRARVIEGSSVELRFTVSRGRFRLRAPDSPGRYVVELSSTRHPGARPARVEFRVMDPRRVVRTPITISLPRDRVGSHVPLRVVSVDDLHFRTRAVRRRGQLTAEIEVEPGMYRLVAGRRTAAAVRLDGTPREVVFAGSRVEIRSDGLPADGRMYQLDIDYADGTSNRVGFREGGASLGDDVPPGLATVRLRAAPRIDPWDPGSPEVRWTVVRTLSIEVPSATEAVWRWSTPSLLAGEDPSARPWTSVPGTGALAPRVPTIARRLFVGHGLHVALGGGAFEHRGDAWRRWTMPPAHTYGASLTNGGPLVRDETIVRGVVTGSHTWAWIEGGPYVSLRTPTGIAQERMPTYGRDVEYPCYSTGIAADASGELIVVGRCRGHGAPWPSAPRGGFIAVRGPESWSVHRGFGPLRAVASTGARVIAVGDDGQVIVREGGTWRSSRHGEADLVGVALAGARVVVRAADGALYEIPARDGAAPTLVHQRAEEGVRHPVADHCAASSTSGARLVVWHRYRDLVDEGSGPTALPDVIAIEFGGTMREVFRSETSVIRAIACDGDGAWMLIAEGSGLSLRRLLP